MFEVKGNKDLLVITRQEFETKLKEEYAKGFSDGSKNTKTTVSKSKAEIKAGNKKVTVRNTVVENADE